MQKSIYYQAGLFIIAALITFALGIWALGSERHVFTRQVEFFSVCRDVQGLAEGAPVRMGGIGIGRVRRIIFSADPKNPNIEESLLVDAEYAERIRQDSQMLIQTQGLLGDKFISLSTGSGEALPPGSIIRSKEVGDIGAILDKASLVVNNTVDISDRISKALSDFSGDTLGNISEAAKTLGDILKNIKEGNGLAHELVYPPKGGSNLLGNLEQSSQNLSEILKEVKNGQGLLHAVIYEKDGQKTVQALSDLASKLGQTASEIGDIATEIKTGNGLIHGLVYSKSNANVDELVQKLVETAENLRRSSEALSQGTGTLGALILDAQVYDNLVEVTAGANRSFFLKEAIKSTLQ